MERDRSRYRKYYTTNPDAEEDRIGAGVAIGLWFWFMILIFLVIAILAAIF